jgi:hypothetical protein
MAKRQKQASKSSSRTTEAAASAPAPELAAAWDRRWIWLAPGLLFAITLFCYWQQLTSSSISILWDAADFFQPIQNYLSQELHAGRIPFWTPYPQAGFPFLADPQVGAWYPLNWPFFLIGVTPRVLFAEHWLHALVACLGAYLLAYRLLNYRPAAVLAGLCYGLSGFFTGHSSHTVMLQTAAWLPWMLLLFDRALETRRLGHIASGCLIAGLIVLAGHFQSALYCFFALALFAAARIIQEPRQWLRVAITAAAFPVMGTLLSAVAVLPGLELATHSIRTVQNAIGDSYGMILPQSLLTLVLPDFYGAASGQYHGPQDITQYYFYAGILLLPLAAWGLAYRALRLPCALIFAVPVWYALGQNAGLFLLIARLPGFGSIRAPVNIWFVPALALALLAAAGLTLASARWRKRWVSFAVLAIFAIDLFVCNFANNQLAYSRTPYDQLYGQGESLFQRAVTSRLPPLARFEAAQDSPAFGPLAHYFTTRTEVTYGYNPLTLSLYHEYLDAMSANPKLRNELNGALWLDAAAAGVRQNPDALPRVLFPAELRTAATPAESLRLLATLDPARQAIVPPTVHPAAQDAAGAARVTEYTPGHYKIHYRCAGESLLRVASAWFEGWSASVNGRTLSVFPVDHALLGIIVPQGEGDLSLDYSSKYFGTGAIVSVLALALCVASFFTRRRTSVP